MIFVTVGSGPLDFSRLVKKMDDLAGELGEEVVIQQGYTLYEPAHARVFSFVPYEEAMRLFQEAEVIVGHASAGPIMNARQFNKPVIIFPRDDRRQELIDGHQMGTARAMEGSSRMIEVIYEAEELGPALVRALSRARSGETYEEHLFLSSLIACIRNFVEEVEKKG